MPYPSIEGREAMYEALRGTVEGGTLELLSASNQVLAIFELTSTAGAVATSGGDVVWTLAFEATEVQGEAAAGVGTTAAKAHIKNSDGEVAIAGFTVTHVSGNGDIKLINTSISENQSVTIDTAVISWPDPEA